MGGGRISCLEVFCIKDVLKNFAKLTENHICLNLFLSKVAGLKYLIVRVIIPFDIREMSIFGKKIF